MSVIEVLFFVIIITFCFFSIHAIYFPRSNCEFQIFFLQKTKIDLKWRNRNIQLCQNEEVYFTNPYSYDSVVLRKSN